MDGIRDMQANSSQATIIHLMQTSKYSVGKGVTACRSLWLHLRWESLSSRVCFEYDDDTRIEQLTAFVQKETKLQNIYLRTGSLQLEYLLTLSEHTVSELRCAQLTIDIQRIEIQESVNGLHNIEVIRCIGTGGFSKVFVGRGYGRMMALKVMTKSFIVDYDKKYIVENERSILAASAGHPFITKLYLSFETANYIVFCMEYCNGGQLFNLLRKVKKMKEHEARFYFLETLTALSYLHSQKILYRDLKPQNIIIDADGHIRLADYGLSKRLQEGKTYSFCGSAEYMAPQMLLKKGHSYEIDYYCLGALVYQLVYGLPPYYSQNQDQLFHNILNKELEFPTKVQTTPEFKAFVKKLLEKNTDLRFKNTQEIFKHPWLKNIKIQHILKKELVPPFKTNMHTLNIDDTEFGPQEISELQNIRKEKNNMNPFKIQFQNFLFQSSQVECVKRQVCKTRLNFAKNKPKAYLNSDRTSNASSNDTRNTIIQKEAEQKHPYNLRRDVSEKMISPLPTMLPSSFSSLHSHQTPSSLFSSDPSSLLSNHTSPAHISSAPTSILTPNELFLPTSSVREDDHVSAFHPTNKNIYTSDAHNNKNIYTTDAFHSIKNIYTTEPPHKHTYNLKKTNKEKSPYNLSSSSVSNASQGSNHMMTNLTNSASPLQIHAKHVNPNLTNSKHNTPALLCSKHAEGKGKNPLWSPKAQFSQKRVFPAELAHKPKVLTKQLSTSRSKGIHHTLSSSQVKNSAKSSQDIKPYHIYQEPLYTHKPTAIRNKPKELSTISDKHYVLSPHRQTEGPFRNYNIKPEEGTRPSLQYAKKLQKPSEKMFFHVPTRKN